MRRIAAVTWFGLCLGALGLRVATGPEVGVWFHELVMIVGFPLAPLFWKGTFELILLLLRTLGSAAETPTMILGHGMTWVGFPIIVYVQWFVIVPAVFRWAIARYRRATNAT